MHILLLGDGHACGYGLPVGQLSYVGHFIRLIGRTGRAVSVEAYADLSLPQVQTTLKHLPLNRYDLIMLQTGVEWLPRPALFGTVLARATTEPVWPAQLLNPLAEPVARPAGATPLRPLRQLAALGERVLLTASDRLRPRRATAPLLALLDTLRPYRHNVLLLTPFPQAQAVGQWHRQRSRAVLLREGMNQLFSVFDTDSVIRPREEYFLANRDYLNATSHELLGWALFDFYQSAPTIVTVQERRPTDGDETGRGETDVRWS